MGQAAPPVESAMAWVIASASPGWARWSTQNRAKSNPVWNPSGSWAHRWAANGLRAMVVSLGGQFPEPLHDPGGEPVSQRVQVDVAQGF